MRGARLYVSAAFCAFLLGLSVYNQAYAGPSRAYAHFMTGIVLDRMDRVQEAVGELESASRLDPQSEAIHIKLALERIKLNENPKAIDELNRALELDPDNFQARTLLAFLYTAEQQLELAQIQYEIILKQASKENPENVPVHEYLGQLYYHQREFEKSLEQFEIILNIDSEYLPARLFKGLILEETGNRQASVKIFRDILLKDPDNADALNALGYLFAESGDNLQEAQDLISKAISQYPQNAAYLDSLGWVYFKQGKVEEAKETIEKAASLLDDPVILDHLGDIYFALNKSSQAEKSWQKALELETYNESLKTTIREKLKKVR